MGDEAEDLAAAVLRSSSDGHLALDLQGRIRWADDAFCTMAAIPRTKIVGTDFGSLFGPAARHRWAEARERAAQPHPGGENRELLIVARDGRRRWTLVSWGPLARGHGTGPTEARSWVRVTEYAERRQLLAALADRERHLGTAHSLAGLGSWTWRVSTDEITLSPGLVALVGADPADLPRTMTSALELVRPEDRARIEHDLFGVLEPGMRLTWQVRMQRADGTLVPVRVLADVVLAEDGSGELEVHGTNQDLSRVLESAAEADEARARLLLLLGVAEAANDAAGLSDALDAARSVLRRHGGWHPSAVFLPAADDAAGQDDRPDLAVLSRPAGPPTADAGGPALAALDLTADQPEVAVLPAPDHALAGEAWRTGEVRSVPAPGHETTHTSLGVPVLLDGVTRAVVQLVLPEAPVDPATVRLVTRMADLLGAVAQREHDARRLAEARDEAEQASRLKSDFLSTMSHEIRTPMNGVIGLTELLLRTPLDDQQQSLTEALRGTGRTLLALINDILDLSRIESGHLDLERSRIDVRAVVEQSVAAVAGQARGKGLQLAVTCSPEVPEIAYGDPVRLGQVVANLCSNAVKFTDVGEVEVLVSMTGPDAADADPLLRVEVRDTGVGVDVGDDPDRLFEAFTQADPSTTRRHGGSGLGLAICRRLVDAMGGRIGLSSAPGLGSTFWFTTALTVPEDVAVVPGPVELRGRRVLVVDDHPASVRSFVAHLLAWGAEPRARTAAGEARAEVRRAAVAGEPYDLVLLDRALPDGPDPAAPAVQELARELMADPDGPGLVLLDGTAPEQGGREGDLAACFHACATKPAVRDDLRHALVVALARGRAAAPRPTTGTVPSGVRVLVAEDNAVNQVVAVGLLESLGCTVDVAVDGEQALARLAPGHGYHVVLMDCRMPRLDGLEATRRLRVVETTAAAPRVPVLAMTASVLNGERERCLAAGMDDFLTKPVSRVHLARALARWASLHRPRTGLADLTGPPDVPDTPAPRTTEQVLTTEPELLYPDEDERPVLDFERVEMLRELVKDGLSFFDRTRESYLSRVDGLLDQLAEAARRDDADALEGLAHQLRGSSANLGLVRVADTSLELEEAARHGDLDAARRLLVDLTSVVGQARRALGSVGRTAESRPGHALARRTDGAARGLEG